MPCYALNHYPNLHHDGLPLNQRVDVGDVFLWCPMLDAVDKQPSLPCDP